MKGDTCVPEVSLMDWFELYQEKKRFPNFDKSHKIYQDSVPSRDQRNLVLLCSWEIITVFIYGGGIWMASLWARWEIVSRGAMAASMILVVCDSSASLSNSPH